MCWPAVSPRVPDDPVAALARYVRLRQPRTAWMQGLSRREEELYQMTDAAAIAERNARMRTNRIPESGHLSARAGAALRL